MIPHVKPIDQVTRDEVRLMAQAAADRGESLDSANVFAHGTDNHRNFRADYLQRECALAFVS